jgi:hypothetical protein
MFKFAARARAKKSDQDIPLENLSLIANPVFIDETEQAEHSRGR